MLKVEDGGGVEEELEGGVKNDLEKELETYVSSRAKAAVKCSGKTRERGLKLVAEASQLLEAARKGELPDDWEKEFDSLKKNVPYRREKFKESELMPEKGDTVPGVRWKAASLLLDYEGERGRSCRVRRLEKVVVNPSLAAFEEAVKEKSSLSCSIASSDEEKKPLVEEALDYEEERKKLGERETPRAMLSYFETLRSYSDSLVTCLTKKRDEMELEEFSRVSEAVRGVHFYLQTLAIAVESEGLEGVLRGLNIMPLELEDVSPYLPPELLKGVLLFPYKLKRLETLADSGSEKELMDKYGEWRDYVESCEELVGVSLDPSKELESILEDKRFPEEDSEDPREHDLYELKCSLLDAKGEMEELCNADEQPSQLEIQSVRDTVNRAVSALEGEEEYLETKEKLAAVGACNPLLPKHYSELLVSFRNTLIFARKRTLSEKFDPSERETFKKELSRLARAAGSYQDKIDRVVEETLLETDHSKWPYRAPLLLHCLFLGVNEGDPITAFEEMLDDVGTYQA